jgi:hypothetical protein
METNKQITIISKPIIIRHNSIKIPTDRKVLIKPRNNQTILI